MSGMQCHLRLWNDVYDQNLATPIGESTQAIFDQGHEVGQLACRLYPKGKLVQADPRDFNAASKETKLLLANHSVSAIFEAAFKYRWVQCSVDILEKLSDGSYHIIEVKSATKSKPVYVLDAAIQYWILTGCGLKVTQVSVMTLNSDYVRGKRLSLRSLFKLHPCSDEVNHLQASLRSNVTAMKQMLSGEDPPNISTGPHCSDPYDCPYFDHCSQDDPVYDHPISELGSTQLATLEKLNSLNIKEIRDIPSTIKLNLRQQAIVDSIKSKTSMVRGNLGSQLRQLKKPIYHLDFETINPAVPKYIGTKPFQAVPFMFSVLKEQVDGYPVHSGYLHKTDDDPRREVALHLIRVLRKRGSICVYSPFEERVINHLIEAFPDLADDLRSIQRRLFDLLNTVRNHVYHPDFRGSFSLKSVLPALTDVDYLDLEIDEGQLASFRYLQALKTTDSSERESIFDDLVAYCDRDTLATFKVKQAIQELVES